MVNLRNIAKALNLKYAYLSEEFRQWALNQQGINAELVITNSLIFHTNGKFYDSVNDRWCPIYKK